MNVLILADPDFFLALTAQSTMTHYSYRYKKLRHGGAIDESCGPEQINSFKSYLEIIKSGIKPTAGFGIGVERLTKFICGLEDIAETSPFPKIPGVS